MDRVRHYGTLLRATYRHRVLGKTEADPRALVLEPARTLYIPVPKAANSSARLALCPVLGIDPASVTEVQKDPRLPTARFSTLAAARDPDWFMFTIVRDPWTRAYSGWYDKVVRMGVQLRALQAMGLEPGDDFETYLAALARWPRRMLNDHFIPQADLLADPLATGRLTVLKSETIAEDWPGVADRIAATGAPRPDAVGHRNASGAGRAPAFSPRAQDLIRRLYANDFLTFGYDDTPPEPAAS